MITRRTFAALSSAERQSIRSRTCARCFHNARRLHAETQRPEDGSPAIKDSAKSASQPAPTKRGRSSQISNELSNLARDPPPGSLAGTNQAGPSKPTASAGFTETPTSIGEGGRMGENVSAGREGVNAQGVGRLSGSDESVRNEHPRPQATRKVDQVQEPAEGGTSVLEASTPRSASRESALKGEAGLRVILSDTRPQGLPVRPTQLSAESLLLQGRGSGVPSRSHPIASVHDRFKLATNPASNEGRGTQSLSSKEARTLAKVLVGGQYDKKGLLKGEKVYDLELLNQIKRKTMINGTYLGSDGDRLVKRVESILAQSRAVPARKRVAPAKK